MHIRLTIALGVFVLVVALALCTDRYAPAILARDIGIADRVVVDKSERMLFLFAGENRIASYSIALGANPEGHKIHVGDSRTPEGSYTLDLRNRNSAFYRSIRLSYPNVDDAAAAAVSGVDPGGEITIHGLPNGLGWLGPLMNFRNWTDGCIAVTNTQMAEIWRAVPAGTAIEIRP